MGVIEKLNIWPAWRGLQHSVPCVDPPGTRPPHGLSRRALKSIVRDALYTSNHNHGCKIPQPVVICLWQDVSAVSLATTNQIRDDSPGSTRRIRGKIGRAARRERAQ